MRRIICVGLLGILMLTLFVSVAQSHQMLVDSYLLSSGDLHAVVGSNRSTDNWDEINRRAACGRMAVYGALMIASAGIGPIGLFTGGAAFGLAMNELGDCIGG